MEIYTISHVTIKSWTSGPWSPKAAKFTPSLAGGLQKKIVKFSLYRQKKRTRLVLGYNYGYFLENELLYRC